MRLLQVHGTAEPTVIVVASWFRTLQLVREKRSPLTHKVIENHAVRRDTLCGR